MFASSQGGINVSLSAPMESLKIWVSTGLMAGLICAGLSLNFQNVTMRTACCKTRNQRGSASLVRSDTVQFRSNRQSRITYPTVDHELWSRSRVTRASVEPPIGHTGPKLPNNNNKNAKKTKIPAQMPKFSRCHAKVRRLPKCRIGKMGHVSHPLSI
jgi:hypothetical protein